MDGSWVESENLAGKSRYKYLVVEFERQMAEIWPD
jgi:hypothetical protein